MTNRSQERKKAFKKGGEVHDAIRLRAFYLLVVLGWSTIVAKGQNSILDSIINPYEARKIVEYLASDSLKGRLTGTAQAQEAATFIADAFKKIKAQAIEAFGGYFMPFVAVHGFGKKSIGYNVLAVLPGKTIPQEIVVYSAHYDHIGTFSINPHPFTRSTSGTDSIFNGANDNASGVAAVILLSRYFAALNNNQRSLLFIAFSGEELGLLGSTALIRKIKPDQYKAVINIEMIGRKPGDRITPFITGPFTSDLRSLLNKSLAAYDRRKYGKSFFANDPYTKDHLFFRSDNYPFSLLRIPAHTLMLTPPDDEFYHSIDDEAGTLDFGTMAKVIQAIALSGEAIINGAVTPRLRLSAGAK